MGVASLRLKGNLLCGKEYHIISFLVVVYYIKVVLWCRVIIIYGFILTPTLS